MLPYSRSTSDSEAADVQGSKRGRHGGSEGLQRLAVALLTVVALVAVHEVLYHLSSILVPFVLSGFLVLAVEPTVEIIYRLLAGIVPPYRWCCCCCARRRSAKRCSSTLGEPTAAGGKPRPQGEAPEGGRWLAWWFEATALHEGDAEAAEAVADVDGDGDSFWEGACRMVAVSVVLSAILLVMFCFISMLVSGALHLKGSWETYRLGMQNLLKWLDAVTNAVSGKLNLEQSVDPQVKLLYNYGLRKLQDMISLLVNEIVSGVYAGASSIIVVFLYVLFWLLRPLPIGIGGKAGALVRGYIWKKTFVSLLYGSWVSLLFLALRNDLAFFFGMVSFCLNFVPEVGAIISILVPVPVILLDGRLESPLLTLTVAVVGQLLLKFLFNNVLEVMLIERDREMSIHPVWVLLGLNYFGFVWGPIGMLMSVPMLALLKSAALSAAEGGESSPVTASWAITLIGCLEGKRGRAQRPPAKMSLTGGTSMPALQGGSALPSGVPTSQQDYGSTGTLPAGTGEGCGDPGAVP